LNRPAAAWPRAVRRSKAFLARARVQRMSGDPAAGSASGLAGRRGQRQPLDQVLYPAGQPGLQTGHPGDEMAGRVRIISARRPRTASMICRAARSAPIDSNGRPGRRRPAAPRAPAARNWPAARSGPPLHRVTQPVLGDGTEPCRLPTPAPSTAPNAPTAPDTTPHSASSPAARRHPARLPQNPHPLRQGHPWSNRENKRAA
jgi:hypothetical protein